MLNHRWATLKITFGFLDCPSCKQTMKLDYEVPLLSDMLTAQLDFKYNIQNQAVEKAIENGYDKEGRVVTPGDIYFGELEEFAMHNCTFYECHKCKKPYFGGMQDCE